VAEIVLEDVTKVYADGTVAVRNVSLEIPDGQLMVLVGPSGCGKTTILRMVAGLEEITDGTVRIGEKVVNEVSAKNRDIAMVFQNYALYPHMNVFDNMAFSLQMRKVKKSIIKEKVLQAAKVLDLEDQLKKRPGALSGGQRQRVAMGRAIVREPQAFLMDEPLSNLDAKLRVQMRAEISRIQRDVGITTMYVTHDQIEAMTLGDTVAVLRSGVLQQIDTPQGLYQRPLNLFVAGFIGSPAMNLIEATVRAATDGMFVEFGGQRVRVDDREVLERPALNGYDGRTIALGIRPEALIDAGVERELTADRRIRATVDLTEDLGSEVLVHFRVNARPVVTEDTKELVEDRGAMSAEELERLARANSSMFVARFDALSKIEEGRTIDVGVNTAALHFFDLQTGAGIYERVVEPAAV
jgi:multiple sugar transport system ATP-binding protein